ncbi:DegT/DnrJ/EryC1/StrS family aminotransferase [Catenulispora yoronensis]|uniref:DegT/DnrJ/EryC1/StrS family aminotransferase n=1 Tax=Catenulispora yoronensis TaxID=450799 RepID=A0ABP5FVF1_9ACTN
MGNPIIPPARPVTGDEEIEAVVRVMRSGILTNGPEVKGFEDDFAELVGGRLCVAVNSGTSALHLSLLALGVKPGDEVIVPSFTFAATANVVAVIGAVPVFVDIEPGSFCLDPAAVEAAITDKTVAIIPVHLYGHPADMDRILPIARAHNLKVVEDAAQAVGASLDGRPVGTFGDTACFSFYPTKNSHAIEGGMIVTADEGLARTLRLLRSQGSLVAYQNEIAGLNNRLSDVHAAVGRVQLAKLPAWTKQRQENAKFFDAHLSGVGVPPVAAGAEHVYHQYTIRVGEEVEGGRDGLRARLAERGVGTGVYYPTQVHQLPTFLGPDAPSASRISGSLEHTEKAGREVLSLPVMPTLTQQELETIVAAVNAL